MRKKDNDHPNSFISVYLLVKIKIKVVYDELRNEFCFSFLFLSEQADKGQLPERTCTAQRSDKYTPAI
jgi:hypothetical protein